MSAKAASQPVSRASILGFGMRTSLLFIAGTRPEIVKLAPVVLLARRRLRGVRLLLTGQQKSLARGILTDFNLVADDELDAPRPGDTLAQLFVRLAAAIETALVRHAPRTVVVQGDTTSAMLGGLLAFSHRLPVAHVEAGLRSRDLDNPYPQEANRRILSAFASLHFAPTAAARNHLLAEGVCADRVMVTGNTVVDAIEHVRARIAPARSGGRQVLVMMYPRESWDAGIDEACRAIKRLALARSGLRFVFPMQANRRVEKQIKAVLSGRPNVRLIGPLGYLALQQALAASWLALTDSGGIQEEAPSHRVPVLVLRSLTERPEAVARGLARVVGPRADAIERAVLELLEDARAWEAMRIGSNPFGDGRAAERIVEALASMLDGSPERLREIREFSSVDATPARVPQSALAQMHPVDFVAA